MKDKEQISIETYTYKDFKKGFEITDDPYNVGNYAKTPERLKTFIECPFVENEDFVMLCLVRANGIVCGRIMLYPVLFKAGDTVQKANGGSSLEVQESYRELDVALDIITYPIKNKISQGIIYADFSKQGIEVYKALRFNVFSMKKMMLAYNYRFFFESKGCKGAFLRIITRVSNFFIQPVIRMLNFHKPNRLKKYSIKEVSVVPSWVDDIVLNDGHKYMEIHNHVWLQWCLNNKYHNKPQNINRFFIVEMNGSPRGFFMTKERYGGIKSRSISPMLTGTIVEWGSFEENNLSEFDIVRLAIPTFSSQIDMIQFASDNESTIRQAKFRGFIHHGFHYIVYRDMTKQNRDAKNQKLWRLRFGYSDSIMN